MTGSFLSAARPPSGHVFRVDRRRGPVWYAKYRLPDGRQLQRKIGPAWTARGRPPAGYFTKRLAEGWLRELLDEARRGTLPGMVQTGATFADAADEFLRYAQQDRALKPTTLRGYRSVINAYLLPAFGVRRLEDITTRDVERWLSGLEGRQRELCNATKNRILNVLHGVLSRARKVWGLPGNPATPVQRLAVRYAGDIEVFSPEEVWALVRAAGSEQEAAIYLTCTSSRVRRMRGRCARSSCYSKRRAGAWLARAAATASTRTRSGREK